MHITTIGQLTVQTEHFVDANFFHVEQWEQYIEM